MKTVLKKTGQKLMRSGLVVATAGAMLFSLTTPPASANETGGFSTFAAVGISQPSNHPQGAQNVTVDVTGKQITVNWERSRSHRGEYRVAVFQGNRPIFASYHLEGPVRIDPARVQTGVTYYISVAPMDQWNVDIIPGSSALSENFVLEETADEAPAPGGSGGATPGEPGEPGSNGPGSGEAEPIATPPTVPTGLRLRLDVKNSTGLELFWFEPDEGDPITNYEIELMGDNQSSKTVNANMQAELPEYVQFSGLQPGVGYQAKVRAQNSAGWGPWSEYTEKIVIPADQDAFKMQIDKAGFGAFVHFNRDKVTISWTQTGYEPENSVYLIRVLCVRDCGNSKSRMESFWARGRNTNWLIDNLQPGVYKAQLKLVDGNKSSETIESEPFTIRVPLEITDPHLKVSPVTMIDHTKENVFTVSGTGYRGDSAAAGVYVVVAEESVWAPGRTPKFSELNRFTAAKHIDETELVDGTFNTTISVPANVLDPTKKYYVGTMAAHALSITDRKLDAGESLVFLGKGTVKPPVVPENPSEHPAQPPVEPGDGNEPGTEPAPGIQPQPGAGQVDIVLSQGGERLQALTAGKAAVVDVTIAGVADGTSYRVVLHSNPVDLGEITLSNNRGQLDISEAEAKKMTPGEHTLRFYNVNDRNARPLELPIRVNPAPADTNAGNTDNSQPPAANAPAITVTPTENINPTVENTFTVKGTNFVGDAARNGVYVVVADKTKWTAGKNPAGVDFSGRTWVRAQQIQNGTFTATVTVPANTFDKAKQYVIGTMAAHELAITNRSLDTVQPLSFANAAAPEGNETGGTENNNPATPEVPGTSGNSANNGEVNSGAATENNGMATPTAEKPATENPAADKQESAEGKTATDTEKTMQAPSNMTEKLPATGAEITTLTLVSLLLLAGGILALRTRKTL